MVTQKKCAHDVPCVDCRLIVDKLIRNKNDEHSLHAIDLPQSLVCDECHEEYPCPSCLKLVMRLRPRREDDQYGNCLLDIGALAAREGTQVPRRMPKELGFGFVEWNYVARRGDGVWLSASKKENPQPGLIRASTTWNDTLSQLRQRLLDCEQSHTKCKGQDFRHISSGEDLYLLDLQDRRLVLSTIDAAPYVCLSYVWGTTKEPLDCRKSRLEALMEAGAFENPALFKPPPTVKSAMEFVKAMGERYLWVDRYCIVQDDNDYKRLQLRRMCQIYAAARYTVIAADGTAADGLVSWDSEVDRHRQHSNVWFSNETHCIRAGRGLNSLRTHGPSGIAEDGPSRSKAFQGKPSSFAMEWFTGGVVSNTGSKIFKFKV
jgi:hypothetical protein